MAVKKQYVSPSVEVIGCESDLPIMGEMTLYTGSPYSDMETVTFDQGGYGSVDGGW